MMASQTRNILVGTALTLITSLGMVQPTSARPLSESMNQQLISQQYSLPTASSNALPLLETDPIRGRITSIDGSRVQLELPNDEVRTYRISESRQERYGLEVGSEVTLRVRRLNNAVTSLSPVNMTFSESSTNR